MRDALAAAGLRAEIDDRSERMQAKVRDAQEQKIPVMLVLGDRDQEAGDVSLAPADRRDGAQGRRADRATSWPTLAGRAERRELWPYADGRAGAGDRRQRMRKMRGVGQLALASTDPLRVAEFYESAFGFKRRAADEPASTWSWPASSSASAAPRSPTGTGCRSDSGSTPPARWTPGPRS